MIKDRLMKYIVVALLGVLFLIAIFLFGYNQGRKSAQSTIINPAQINTRLVDSLKRISDLYYKLNSNYDSLIAVKERIKTVRIYAHKEKVQRDATYRSLDTAGRVAYFRAWLRDSAVANGR